MRTRDSAHTGTQTDQASYIAHRTRGCTGWELATAGPAHSTGGLAQLAAFDPSMPGRLRGCPRSPQRHGHRTQAIRPPRCCRRGRRLAAQPPRLAPRPSQVSESERSLARLHGARQFPPRPLNPSRWIKMAKSPPRLTLASGWSSFVGPNVRRAARAGV